jgi:hypothetical protein
MLLAACSLHAAAGASSMPPLHVVPGPSLKTRIRISKSCSAGDQSRRRLRQEF